jgi:hypothetical protein
MSHGTASHSAAAIAAPRPAGRLPPHRLMAQEMEQVAAQQMAQLSAQFLACQPRAHSNASAADEAAAAQAAIAATSVVSSPAAAVDCSPDPLSVSLSLAYRLCVLLSSGAPDAWIALQRTQSLWFHGGGPALVRHALRWLDEGTQAGQPLSYIFVRFMALMVAAVPDAGKALLMDASQQQQQQQSQPQLSSVVPLLSALLRLSDAPLLLRELVELVAAFVGVADMQVHLPLLFARAFAQQAADEFDQDEEPEGAEEQAAAAGEREAAQAAAAEAAAHESKMAAARQAQLRTLFAQSFISSQGRALVLLAKHVRHPLLAESSRTTLLRALLAFVMSPSASSSASSSNWTVQARESLAGSWARWATDLPPSSTEDAENRPVLAHDIAEAQKRVTHVQRLRKQQTKILKELRAILVVTTTAGAASSSSSSAASATRAGFASVAATSGTGPLSPSRSLISQPLPSIFGANSNSSAKAGNNDATREMRQVRAAATSSAGYSAPLQLQPQQPLSLHQPTASLYPTPFGRS